VASSTFYPKKNGVTVTILDQTLKLAERGHEMHIATRRFPGTRFHEVFHGIHVWRISPEKFYSPVIQAIFVLRLAALIYKLIVSSPFDIIHADGPAAAMAAKMATWGLKLPLVTTFTGPDPLWYPALRRKAPRLFSLFERFTLIVSDRVTVSTERNKRTLLRNHGEKIRKKIRVIPRGVDLELFRPTQPVPHANPSVLFVGTVCHRKGTDILLMAAPKILEKHPNAKFLLVGEITAYRTKLDELIRELKIGHAVEFAGSVREYKDMPRYFEAGDVLVLPSRPGGEGFGRVIIEAMAKGLPVVASRIRGPIDIITHEKSGILVNPEDPDDLAEKILYVLENKSLAVEMGKEGQRIARERYDLNSVTSEIEDIYKMALFRIRSKVF
jgi:glycosyltransferase involved in cell wall biosynthesis